RGRLPRCVTIRRAGRPGGPGGPTGPVAGRRGLGANLRPYLLARLGRRDRRSACVGPAVSLVSLDGGDELALAHPGGAGQAERGGDALQLREELRRQTVGGAVVSVCDVGGARCG